MLVWLQAIRMSDPNAAMQCHMFMCTCEKCESIEREGRKGERERERESQREEPI